MKQSIVVCGLAALLAGPGGQAAQEPGGAEGRLKIADDLMAHLRYREALAMYRSARVADDAAIRVRAGAGAIRALLRLGRFSEARQEGASIAEADPRQAAALAVHGDALWAAGLFVEAEAQYAAALAIDPGDARARHGRGRSLAARHRPGEALADIMHAIGADPRDPVYRFSLGRVYELQRRYAEAAAAFTAYADLLSDRDVDMIRSAQARAQFLRSFRNRLPFQILSTDEVYTVPFRIDDGLMVVSARVNGTSLDLVVDTGAESAVLSPDAARRAGVGAMAAFETAGVGEQGYGFRNMQIARIDRLEIGALRAANITCLIKSPSLPDIPVENEAFSPLSLGLSMAIDYRSRTITLTRRRLPDETYDTWLPLRMTPLATVGGMINGTSPVSFVLDTGGQGTSLSRVVVSQLDVDTSVRRVPARVRGIAGWDRTAFLLPYIDIELAEGVDLRQRSVVVLNLDAPSALLGFQIGGILGQEFLHRYAIAIDLDRSEVGFRKTQ